MTAIERCVFWGLLVSLMLISGCTKPPDTLSSAIPYLGEERNAQEASQTNEHGMRDDSDADNTKSSDRSPEPVYFTGTEEEIRDQKLKLWLKNKYREVDLYYFEEILGYGDPSYIYADFFETDERYYTKEEISAYDNEDFLKLAKNEIYARKGRMFYDQEIYNYFLTKMWYEPKYTPEEFDESCFNEYERANLEILVSLGA